MHLVCDSGDDKEMSRYIVAKIIWEEKTYRYQAAGIRRRYKGIEIYKDVLKKGKKLI
jgi:hypothetical protein